MILSKVAFPKEHGAWGFVLEPLLLSLLVAYTFQGLLLAIAIFFLFLANQPIRIVLNNSASKKFKSAALVMLTIYLSISLLLVIFLIFEIELVPLTFLFIALVLMFLFLVFEFYKYSRKLLIEFIPIISMTLVALSIITINQNVLFNPLVFAFILLSRSVPTVFYVNDKLRDLKRIKSHHIRTHTINLIFTISIFFLILANLTPALSFVAMLILVGRTFLGYSRFNFTKSVKQIGVTEFIVGLVFVIINAFAFCH